MKLIHFFIIFFSTFTLFSKANDCAQIFNIHPTVKTYTHFTKYLSRVVSEKDIEANLVYTYALDFALPKKYRKTTDPQIIESFLQKEFSIVLTFLNRHNDYNDLIKAVNMTKNEINGQLQNSVYANMTIGEKIQKLLGRDYGN